MTAGIRSRYDVAVVGGGPAGATAAALLARAGLDVACFERERFPRFHIGESLLPASVPLFERIGVLPAIEAAGFIHKRGAAFIDDVEGRQVTFHFRRGRDWADHAYNVPRADFDRLLLDHAAQQGAAVFEATEVETVALEGEQVHLGVRAEHGDRCAVAARFLVDATGRDALVAARLGRREPMPSLGKVALFAHYRGGERWPGRTEGYIRIYLFEHGWFWWIPFAGDLTSVGCVLHQRVVKARQAPVERLGGLPWRARPPGCGDIVQPFVKGPESRESVNRRCDFVGEASVPPRPLPLGERRPCRASRDQSARGHTAPPGWPQGDPA